MNSMGGSAAGKIMKKKKNGRIRTIITMHRAIIFCAWCRFRGRVDYVSHDNISVRVVFDRQRRILVIRTAVNGASGGDGV